MKKYIYKLTIGRILFLLSMPIYLACCTASKQSDETKSEAITGIQVKIQTKSTDLILVNCGDLDRCEMGALIGKISKCHPNAIGLNFLYVERRGPTCDSVLRKAIIDADNVILTEQYEGEKHVTSHPYFSNVAFSSGMNGLLGSDDGVANEYYCMLDHRGKWELSFPFLLALQVHKDKAAQLSSRLTDKSYPISFYRSKDDFTILNAEENFDSKCSLIEGNVVIIGYIGPGRDDMLPTPVTSKSSDKSYETVILANIILNIVKED